MKMKTEHFEQLRALINSAPNPVYAAPVSDKRQRWDKLWAIPYRARELWFRENEIYSYLDDSHIDTALRRIVPADYTGQS